MNDKEETNRILDEIKASERGFTYMICTAGAFGLFLFGGGVLSDMTSNQKQKFPKKKYEIEYKQKKAKLDSVYQVQVNGLQSEKVKIYSIYQAKQDSLKKVYENKLEKRVK